MQMASDSESQDLRQLVHLLDRAPRHRRCRRTAEIPLACYVRLLGRAAVQFSILGPLEIRRDGAPVQLAGDRQRALLAFLLLHAGEVVSTELLAEELWGEEPRAAAARLVETHVDSLRRVIGRDALAARFPGYLVRVEDDDLDLRRFEGLVEDGRAALAAGQAQQASLRLHEALQLWRGPALADFRRERFAQGAIARLEELRLAAIEERIEADLALGAPCGDRRGAAGAGRGAPAARAPARSAHAGPPSGGPLG